LTVNALVCSTHLLVPIQAAYFAIEGTMICWKTYERIRARPNPNLKVLGVVITLFDKRTNISKDTHGQIRSVFGEVLFKTKISKTFGSKRARRTKKRFDLRAEITWRRRVQKLAAEVIHRVEENRTTRRAEDAA